MRKNKKLPQQTTDTLVMIAPDTFQYNVETAQTNSFQSQSAHQQQARENAQQEFADMVAILRLHAINIIVLPSRTNVVTPDAVFPNNWFSMHASRARGNILVTYPMLAPSRRAERQTEVLIKFLRAHAIRIQQQIDFTHYEKKNQALEGTGSFVLDRVNKIAYAAISPRTSKHVLQQFATKLGYRMIAFHSYTKPNNLTYHTNVMLSVGTHFAVICAASIKNIFERYRVLQVLRNSGKQLLLITQQQMKQMAGNILEVQDRAGQAKLILSRTAYYAFTSQQRSILRQYAEFVIVDIPTIETLGGGSARCMLAEVFYVFMHRPPH